MHCEICSKIFSPLTAEDAINLLNNKAVTHSNEIQGLERLLTATQLWRHSRHAGCISNEYYAILTPKYPVFTIAIIITPFFYLC